WVVGDRIQLDVDDTARLCPGVTHRTVDLRHAAQAVGVLWLHLLPALERQEAPIERFAVLPPVGRYPAPGQVETKLAVIRLAPGIGGPRLEARHQVVGNVQQR